MRRSSHSTCTQRVVKQKSVLVNHACLGVLHRLRSKARHCCDVGEYVCSGADVDDVARVALALARQKYWQIRPQRRTRDTYALQLQDLRTTKNLGK
jgi:hypothetical protein